MKKTFILLLVVTVGGVVKVNAQSGVKKILGNLSGGLKAEVNSSGFLLSDMSDTKSKMGMGGSFGTFVKYKISNHFAIQEDILFTYKTSSIEQGNINRDYRYLGTEIPIYAMGQWKTKNNGLLYVGVGPCASFGFSAKYKQSENETNVYKKNGEGDAPMKKLDFGFSGLVGYEFSNRLQLNASYKMGLTNMLNEPKDNASMRSGVFGLGIAYRFGSE